MSGISNVNSEVGTPTNTTVPARSRAYKACFHVSGRPTASTTTSAPNPPVSSCTASTGLASEASIVWVAPNSVAHCSFFGSRSMAMIGDAPANRALAIAESPTPRTRSPRPNPHARHCLCSPRRRGRPSHRSQASRPPRGRRSDRPGCIGARVPGSYRRTRAERRGQLRAVGQRHRPAGVEGVEAIPGAARGGKPGSDRRPPASSARRSHRSPHVTAVPADSTMPAASWPSRNGKSSLTPSR